MTTNNLVDVVRHYQRSIERHQEDQGRLLHCVTKLYSLPIKVEHLQETGVGKTVNSLRKFNGEVGVAAKTLVTKWKAMVAAEEEPVVSSTVIDQHITKSRSSSDEDQDENKQNNSSSGEEQNRQSLTADLRKHESSHHNHRKSSSQEKRKHSEHKSSDSSRHRSSSKSHEKSHHKSSRDKIRHRGSSGDRTSRKEDIKSEEKKHKESNTKADSKNSSRSSKRKRDSSNERDQKSSKDHALQRDHEEERHKEHRSERDKSAKDSKEHSSRSKDDKHRHNLSTKQDHKHSDKHKSHSSSSKTSTKQSSSSFKNAEEVPGPDVKRQRKDSDEHEEKSPDTKITKVKSKSKQRHEVDVNASSNEEDDADETGFDSTKGANFADVLGMLNAPMSSGKKTKKTISKSSGSTNLPSSSSSTSAAGHKSTATRSPSANSSLSKKADKTEHLKNINDVKKELTATRKPELLSSSAKLEPLDPTIVLDLPTISTNYKPMPLNQTMMDCVFSSTSSVAPVSSTTSTYKSSSARVLDESELLAQGISSKTMRTKIYSGSKPGQLLQVPSLFDLCIRVLQKNIDALEYTGGVPFDVLKPVLERATPQQLLTFEDYNPYLMEDSDELWRMHVQRQYRTQRRQEMETWREMFMRCQEEKDHKLSVLAESIKQQQKMNEAPVRKTQLAFVDSMVKPPRGVQRRQDQYGTRGKLIATPAARVPALSKVTPNAAKAGDARLRVIAAARDTAQMAVAPIRSKKAPLMAKTLQFIRGRQKR